MKKIIFLVCVVFLTSCAIQKPVNPENNTQTNSGDIANVTPQIEQNLSGEVQEPLRNDLPGAPNEYTLLFEDTMKETLTITHSQGEQTKIFFINSQASSMQVKIDFVDEPGNFRLSQIIAPDGTSDGPFGTDTTYELTQFGGYQLILSESNMQGDMWNGKANISIELKK